MNSLLPSVPRDATITLEALESGKREEQLEKFDSMMDDREATEFTVDGEEARLLLSVIWWTMARPYLEGLPDMMVAVGRGVFDFL